MACYYENPEDLSPMRMPEFDVVYDGVGSVELEPTIYPIADSRRDANVMFVCRVKHGDYGNVWTPRHGDLLMYVYQTSLYSLYSQVMYLR